MSAPLVRVEHVSKKFCRSLKRSLWYGVQDIGVELAGGRDGRAGGGALRKDEFWAVRDVSLELHRGDCLALIGRNGAGKSTLLKMLNGLLKPDAGRIEMRGRIGALIELGTGFNPILSGRENVYVNGSILGFSKKEIDRKFESIVEFSEIGEFIDTPVKNYSSGMKVRLGFAVAAQMDPDVLLIDEVLAVGDVGFRIKCYNEIYRIVERAAVIFVSHSMSQVSKVCNRGVLLDSGQAKAASSNIAEIVDAYYEQFGFTGIQVTGNGMATIVELAISGNEAGPVEYAVRDGAPVQEESVSLGYGERLHLSLLLQVDPSIARFDVFYAFVDVDQKLVAQCFSDIHFGNADQGGAVRIGTVIDCLNLNRGKYSLTVTVREVDDGHNIRSILAKYQQVAELRVVQDVFLGAALVQYRATWERATELAGSEMQREAIGT